MATTKTRDQIEQMSKRERLRYEADQQVANQIEESDLGFAKSYSQLNNQFLRNGTQRSSYKSASLGNLLTEQEKARNRIREQGNVLYSQNLRELEKEEQEQANWQQTFDYQKERDIIADQQWQQNYNEQLRQFNENMAFQKERAHVSDEQWEKQYAQAKEQFDAQMEEQKRQFDAEFGLKSAAATPAASPATTNGNPGTDNGRDWFDEASDNPTNIWEGYSGNESKLGSKVGKMKSRLTGKNGG